jgi:predicted dehydrogenase
VSVVAARPRLGFLGIGWIGRQRLEAVAATGTVDIAGWVDPALEGGVATLADLLEDGTDGIVIATPSGLHEEQAEEALTQGAAVFCQKPLAVNANGAQRVVAAAQAADRLLAVDFCYRHTQAAQGLKRAVEDGSLGEILRVELAFHSAYAPSQAWSLDPRLAGGGCLLDLGIHLVDLLLWTLGPQQLEPMATSITGNPLENHVSAQLRLESGAPVRLSCSWNLHAGRDCIFEVTLYGARSSVSMHNVHGSFFDFTTERYVQAGRTCLAAPPDDWSGRAIVEWATRLAAGEGFDPAAEAYVDVHRALDAVYEFRQ